MRNTQLQQEEALGAPAFASGSSLATVFFQPITNKDMQTCDASRFPDELELTLPLMINTGVPFEGKTVLLPKVHAQQWPAFLFGVLKYVVQDTMKLPTPLVMQTWRWPAEPRYPKGSWSGLAKKSPELWELVKCLYHVAEDFRVRGLPGPANSLGGLDLLRSTWEALVVAKRVKVSQCTSHNLSQPVETQPSHCSSHVHAPGTADGKGHAGGEG